jgi:glycosyltransferase involved in cell wall biosynthesis
MESVKRPMMWIEAARQIAKQIPEAHFVIIGGGEMTKSVRDFADSCGLTSRLHLPGQVLDVGAWYRIMDVMLLTSEREGIPNAILEAQHFGIPVVATDVGGIREAIELGVTGYVVSGRDAQEYADRVISVIKDDSWVSQARRRAPEFVHQRFQLTETLDQLLGFYGIGQKRRLEKSLISGQESL